MVSSGKANHSLSSKALPIFQHTSFRLGVVHFQRDGFSDKSSFQDYLLNLSSSATLGQMLSVLWPIRHPEVQPGGGGDRVVVVGSAVRNCSPGLQTIQKVDDVTYGKWKTLSQITHTLRQPKRRPTQKKEATSSSAMSFQINSVVPQFLGYLPTTITNIWVVFYFQKNLTKNSKLSSFRFEGKENWTKVF